LKGKNVQIAISGNLFLNIIKIAPKVPHKGGDTVVVKSAINRNADHSNIILLSEVLPQSHFA
jgi:hypothetical protein